MIRSWRPTGEQAGQQTTGKARESQAANYGAAWSIFGVLLSGVLAWGGIGWLLDQWLDTGFFLPVGLIVGSVGGVYLSYRRFGIESGQLTEDDRPNDGDDDNATAKFPTDRS